MLPTQLSQLTAQHIQTLVEQQRQEDRGLEYKQQLPSGKDSEKVPLLLKPACAFANTDGGDLVFGIAAKDGVPTSASGVPVENLDKEKLRLLQLIQDGIEPQLRSIEIQEVEVSDGRYVLVVRIPKSWIPPHRVKTNAQFYARSAAGSYELDVPQLRSAFMMSEATRTQIRDFRAQRIAAALGSDAPMPLASGPLLMFHVAPLVSFSGTPPRIDARDYDEPARELVSALNGGSRAHNVDGIVAYMKTEREGCLTYAQFFRNGVIEFCEVMNQQNDNGRYVIASQAYEETVMEYLKGAIRVFERLALNPPYLLFLSLVNAKGMKFAVAPRYSWREHGTISKNMILLPDIEMESKEEAPEQVLRPIFDMVWNSAGYESSLNYNKEGKWVGQR